MSLAPDTAPILSGEEADPGLDHVPFDHVMIDIETMSLHPPKALILSIGAVEFDPAPAFGPRVGGTFCAVLNISDQIMMQRRVDPDTQKFWADPKQAEASYHWRYGKPESPVGALMGLQTFCAGKSRIWAN